MAVKNGKTPLYWLITSLNAIALTLTNPRGIIGLITFTLIGVIYLVSNRKKNSKNNGIILLGIITTLIVGFAVIFLSNNSGYLQEIILKLQKVVSRTSVTDSLLNISGVFLYSIYSTFGIILFGIYFGIKEVWSFVKKNQRKTSQYFALFALLLYFLTLITNGVMQGKAALVRGDYLIYGRYIEAVSIPLLILGISNFVKNKIDRKKVISFLVIGLIPVLITYIWRKEALELLDYNGMNVFGLYWMRILRLDWRFNLDSATIIAIAGSLLIYLVGIKQKQKTLIILTVVFSLLSSLIWFDYFYRGVTWRSKQLMLVTPLREYVKESNSDNLLVNYSPNSLSLWHKSAYETYLPKINFSPSEDDLSKAPFLITHNLYVNRKIEGARLIGLENHANQHLWLLPNNPELLSLYQKIGYILPEDFPSRLDPRALSSTIEFAKERFIRFKLINPGELEIPIVLTHAGEGSFWPNKAGGGKAKDRATVQLKINVSDLISDNYISDYVVNLPSSVYPKQSLKMDFAIKYKDFDEGQYVYSIELVQNAYELFSKSDDSTIKKAYVTITKHKIIIETTK